MGGDLEFHLTPAQFIAPLVSWTPNPGQNIYFSSLDPVRPPYGLLRPVTLPNRDGLDPVQPPFLVTCRPVRPDRF